MKKTLRKPFSWMVLFTLILSLSSTYVLLDAFVIPRTLTPVVASSPATSVTAGVATGASEAIIDPGATGVATGADSPTTSSGTSTGTTSQAAAITANSYSDENIRITIETVRLYNTNVYIADIEVSSVEYLKTAFANGAYGRNIKETTSEMAESNQAIFAINGDYYGFRDYGYVLRNGTLYRETGASGREDLVIKSDGNFSIINESQTSAESLLAANAWQVLSFGPALISDGQVTVTANSEVGQSMQSNPRTAIGMISPLHYMVVVSDGRTSDNAGLSLLELARIMADQGCTVAYNLDGGGSSTMWFNGQVINNPTSGRSSSERSVSDIVYFGY